MTATNDTVNKLKNALVEAQLDRAWVKEHIERNRRREVIQKELNGFLAKFVAGRLSMTEFRETFDRKTRKEWDGFGLKGLSGAMFLNKLVKHIPDQTSLTARLKDTL